MMSVSLEMGMLLLPSKACETSVQYRLGSCGVQPMKGFLADRLESRSLAGNRTRESKMQRSVEKVAWLLMYVYSMCAKACFCHELAGRRRWHTVVWTCPSHNPWGRLAFGQGEVGVHANGDLVAALATNQVAKIADDLMDLVGGVAQQGAHGRTSPGCSGWTCRRH